MTSTKTKVVRSKLVGVFFYLCGSVLYGQDTLLLGESEFLRQVLLYHPVLMNEELDVERARQGVQVARAAFDPIWTADWFSKNFDDKQYYEYQQTALSWQAPPGFKFKVGSEVNRGDFINPEFSTPAEGLTFAELAVPLGDGLFRTPAQTRLQKSRVDAERAVSELELTSRRVVLGAADLYWNWVASNKELDLRDEILVLTEERYNQIRIRFRQGLATGMDTLEAYTQLLQRQNDKLNTQQQLELWFRNAGNLIWDDVLYREYSNGRIYTDTVWRSQVESFRGQRRSPLINPMLEINSLRIQSAKLDRLLARERMKPDLEFKAKAITQTGAYNFSTNDAVFGFSAYFPLLSRRERAEAKIADIKLTQLEVELSAREREIVLQYEQFTTQINLLREQERIIGENVENARELLNMENRLLLFGESTLIRVNIRESNYINAQLRYIDIRRKRILLEWRLLLLTHSAEELLF